MAVCQQSRPRGRLAVVCLVPDPGHLLPLLKLAAQGRRTCDVLVLVPDELVDLAASHGFEVAGFGSVRPAAGLPDLHRYINASEWVRIASAYSACQTSYFDPLAQAIKGLLGPLRERLTNYRPTHALVDDHLMPSGLRKVFDEHGCRILFHCTAPNYRRHNTWSLASCFWTCYRAAVKDIAAKTRNELRLRIRSRAAKRRPGGEDRSVAPSGPVPPRSVHHLSTGTSYLEKTLLSDRLLYAGEDRLVLPAVPPLQAPLPQDLGDWLEKSPSADVVYVSFGTMIQPTQAAVINIVTAALDENRRVLLQYAGEFPAMPGVRVESWLPQTTVLSHPAVALFVTHGGAASVEEALWAGKPMLCIPGVWDHYYNSRIVTLLGAGISIPRRRIGSRRRLSNAVRTAMKPAHAETARALAGLMREQWSAHEAAVADLFVPLQRKAERKPAVARPAG